LLYFIASPVGPYYKNGFNPISLFASTEFIRAAPGGTGNFKIGGNYSPTLLESGRVQKLGHSQVLWLFDKQITEVGTMNFFLFWTNTDGEKELITPPLGSNLILPGVTRDSVLQLARDMKKFKVSEKILTIDELCLASNEGRIIEAFGAGTAAVISPVKGIDYQGKYYAFPTGDKVGELAQTLWNKLTSIQYGEIASHPWVFNVDKDFQIKESCGLLLRK